jgi:hypothetical protein
MSGQHEMPTASDGPSSQATPARRRGHLCTAVNQAELHLSSPDSCSNGWGHLSISSTLMGKRDILQRLGGLSPSLAGSIPIGFVLSPFVCRTTLEERRAC